MKRLAAAPAALLLLLALALPGCGQGGPGGSGAQSEPTLTLESSTLRPQQLLLARVQGVAVPEQVSGTLGALPITARRVDEGVLALLVPAAAQGALALQLTVEGHALSATVDVGAALPVAEPAAFLEAAYVGADAELAALEAKYADPARRPPTLDLAQFQGDLAKMRAERDAARAAIAAATGEQRAQLAAFVAANAELLGLGTASAARPVTARADGACLSESGALLETHEQCAQALQAFSQRHIKRLIALAALSAVAFVEGATGVGVVLGARTLYLLYKELCKIQDGVLTRFLDPVLAKLSHPSTYAAGPQAQSVRALAGSDNATYPEGKPAVFATMAIYRSLSSTDEGPLLDVARTLERGLNRVRAVALLAPLPALVPARPTRFLFERVPARYLQLGAVSPVSVLGSASASGEDWLLTFTQAGLKGTAPFTFAVRYLPPDRPEQSMTVNGTLSAVRFVEGTLSAGAAHGCGLTVLGDVYCWGDNSEGQLGNGTLQGSSTPVLVAAGGRAFKQVTAGNAHTCALDEQGAAWCWGLNASGQLGNGTRDPSPTPVPVSGGLTFERLSAGKAGHTCGLTTDKVGYCWGSNAWWALGDGAVPCDQCQGTLPARLVPTRVVGGHAFKDISAGWGHTCALTTAGVAYCWGQNEQGQVGSGDACYQCKSSTPLRVTGDTLFASISAGGRLTVALTAEGEPYEWGYRSLEPFLVFPNVRFSVASAGLSSACGLWAAGSASCWGMNGSGQRGDGTTNSGGPGPVQGGYTFRSISVGADFALALNPDGVTYGWGANGSGQLGGLASPQQLTPVTAVGSVRFE